MKVIDLLNKIANEEIKDKTIFRIKWGHIYRDFYYDSSEENQLQCLKNCSDDYSIYDDINLNDEIEIIEDTPKEDKEIKKLNTNWQYSFDTQVEQYTIELICKKINEIIDRLNGEDNE